MKRWITMIVLSVIFQAGFGQTVFSYGPYKVGREEFLRAYHKNGTGEQVYRQSITEYLELYTRFKLKVQAAYDLRLDTLPNQLSDAQSFGRQIEDAYLIDTVMERKMMREAWERSLRDIDVSHIFIPFRKPDGTGQLSTGPVGSADSAQARAQMQEVQKSLKEGASFEAMALRYSADPDVQRNRGRIGYITVFTLPYSLESAAYNLGIGQVSGPVISKAGYHFLKKNAERPAVGRVKLAQILVAIAPPGGPAERASAKKLADSLYALLQAGADFAELAAAYSNDRNSFSVGGMLPEFGLGEYDPAFEDAAFALQKEGAISSPLETGFGYHILKKAGHTPVEQNREKAEPVLRSEYQLDARSNLPRIAFQQEIRSKTGYRKSSYHSADLWKITDGFLTRGEKKPSGSLTLQSPLFLVGGKKQVVEQWLEYLREKEAAPDRRQYPALLDSFVSSSATAIYREKLEIFNPAYAAQMREFKEGNLLFEVMEKQVWSKAAQDTAGLRKYYEAHREKYNWAPSADVLAFTASDQKTGEATLATLKKSPAQWRNLVESQAGRLMGDSARIEVSQLSGFGFPEIKAGAYSAVSSPDPDGAVSFAHIVRVYTTSSPRGFEDARGMVMNDYQLYLEEQWIQALRKKYPVVVNQAEWQKILSLR